MKIDNKQSEVFLFIGGFFVTIASLLIGILILMFFREILLFGV
jgi:hypothetical protein